MGSDGTVYAWTFTDGTPNPGYTCTHTAYATTTLTSPKGRKASSSRMSGINTVRSDVSLPFDATDRGAYSTAGTSDMFCNIMGWFILGAVSSSVSNNAAYPVNFRLTASGPSGVGLLFSYYWDSSSGKLPDLTDCAVYEVVNYPGGDSPYVWPKPPWNTSNTNPYSSGVNGSDGLFDD